MTQEKYNNKDIKILIVDDVADSIQVIGSILMEQGYDISFSSSGNEALTMISNNSYDLLLLDILMPLMDGFELCEKITQDPSTAKTPIVFLTAKTDQESIAKGFALGARDYVSKPFKTEELLARVKTQVELIRQREQLEKMNTLLENKVRERTRQLSIANQQLQNLEKAKNNFLSLISHELRTPLNILSGFSQILEESLKKTEDLDALQHIMSASEKLIKLSETALLITELQLGNYDLILKQTNLAGLCRKLIEAQSKKLAERNIIIQNNVFGDIYIKGNPPLLLNSLQRLLENAMEAIKANGTITIGLEQTEKETVFSISDTGPGFAQATLDQVFDLFAKEVENSLHAGFGLGLPAVKLVMDLHGASVHADNQPEGGAVITLRFPSSH